MPDLSPEEELLLCCARTRLDPGSDSRIRALVREGLDWAYLLRTALPHGMMPLVYWHLQATCPESIARAILDSLRDHFHRNIQNNMFLTGELLKVLRGLEAHGVRAIPFKGPVLAASVYGNLSLRQFSDLDLLVHRRDVPKARDFLTSLGYQAQLPLPAAHEEAFLHSRCELPFARHDDGVIVELHWAITPGYFSFPLDIERLWERLEPVALAGKTVPSLSREDLLLILCVHGCQHLWERLEWICGVAELLRIHHGMDWGRVMEQARMLGSERILFLGLLLVSDLLGATPSEEVLREAQADLVAKSLAVQVRDRLFRGVDDPPGVFKCSLFHLRARERLRDRVQYCFRFATTPTVGDWAFMPLPRSLWVLSYLLRPIRLIGKYALSPLKRRRSIRKAIRPPAGGASLSREMA